MRNLCVPLEDNEVTCPCCLQKPPPSRSMRVVHLRVVRFPIPQFQYWWWRRCLSRLPRCAWPGQDEREADRKRSEHAAGTACAPCRPRRRVLALFCQSLPGLLISRLFPCNNHQIIANTKGTCLLISRLFPCWSNRQGDESFGRSSRIR